MNKKIKIIIAAIIIIIIAAVGYAAVNSSTDDDPTHLVVTANGHAGEPETGFDPLTGWGCGHLNFNPLIQSTLLTSDENGNFVNDLATNYSISSDGLTWTVDIRDDVLFSDNSSLTAKDVAFTFNEAKTSNSQLDITNLDSATAVNDTRVEFKLAKPQSSFIYHLRYIGIVKADGYDNATYGSNPIGSGPYKLKQWDKGQQAIFEVNENYYGKKPYFTQLTMLFPEEDTAFQYVKSGQADVVQAPFTSLNETVDGYKLIEYDSPRAQGLSLPFMNNTGLTTDQGNPVGNNVTADLAIRKALNIGIDRQSIIDSVYKGHGKIDYTGADSQLFANEEAKITDNNTEEAKQILENAGWVDTNGDGIREKDGQNASFKLYYSSSDQARQSLATVISEQAKELGINIELVGTDWDTIYQNMYSQAVLMQQSSDDPYRAVYQQYHSKESFVEDDYMNPNEYNNSAVDAVLEQAMSATSQDEANKLWAKAAYISSDSGYGANAEAPWLWVADYNYCYFVKDGINMGTAPTMGQDYMENICDWTRENTTTS
ncbi:ABC transporter substrate-binding protein [Methanosphaera sp.]